MDNHKPSFGWEMFRLVSSNTILFYFRKRARLRLEQMDKKRHGDLEGNMMTVQEIQLTPLECPFFIMGNVLVHEIGFYHIVLIQLTYVRKL